MVVFVYFIRAVHLELVSDLSTETFVAALNHLWLIGTAYRYLVIMVLILLGQLINSVISWIIPNIVINLLLNKATEKTLLGGEQNSSFAAHLVNETGVVTTGCRVVVGEFTAMRR